MHRDGILVRSIWAACLLVGGLNHARTLLQHGLSWDYGGVARISANYWSSLTILDPAVAILLFARPRAGIVCTIVLIVTNVIHNLAVSSGRTPQAGLLTLAAADPYIVSQICFMLFVLATAGIAWKGVVSSKHATVTPRSTP